MTNLPEHATQPFRITAAGDRFEQVYELMKLEFDADVLEELEWYEYLLGATARGEHSNPFIVFGVADQHQRLHGYIAGNYMPLPADGRFAGRGFGAIGHIFSSGELRGSGIGSTLLEAFTEECRKVAAQRSQELFAILGEVQVDATGFFGKRGFAWPKNVFYAQPPLIYERTTGDSVYPEVPENLMLRLETAAPLSKDLLCETVRSLYRYWIVEKHEILWREQPASNVARVAQIVDATYAEVETSILGLPQETIELVAPPPSTLQSQDPKSGLSLRELTAGDLPQVESMLAEIFDSDSVGKATSTCRRFLSGRHEPLAQDTVYLAVDRDGALLGIAGVYVITLSTGRPSLFPAGSCAARLGWFGLRPSARGGLGRVLLTLTETVASRSRLTPFCIETSNNPLYSRASELYRRCGYVSNVDIPDYFGPGRPVTHVWWNLREREAVSASSTWRPLPLTRELYESHRSSLDALFGDSAATFAECARGHLEALDAPLTARAHWLITSDFQLVLDGNALVAAFGLGRYEWLRHDVLWCRWMACRGSLSQTALLTAILDHVRRVDGRVLVLELDGDTFLSSARELGFEATRSIPNLYMPQEEWVALAQHDRQRGLMPGDVPLEAESRPLEFLIFSKALGRT